MPRPPRPDDGRVRRETAPPWRTAHGWVQSRSPLQDMVCRLGCKPIFYSLESRFDNFLTGPKQPFHSRFSSLAGYEKTADSRGKRHADTFTVIPAEAGIQVFQRFLDLGSHPAFAGMRPG